MNARLPVAVVAAVLALSCSSKQEPVTAGGAMFQLTPPSPASLGICPDTTSQPNIVANRGENNGLVLVLDGADDARVSCKYDGTNYAVTVSKSGATFSASGSIQNNESTDAYVFVLTANNQYEQKGAAKCKISFIPQGEPGRLEGRNVTCTALEHSSLPNGFCATNPGNTFFKFTNCKP